MRTSVSIPLLAIVALAAACSHVPAPQAEGRACHSSGEPVVGQTPPAPSAPVVVKPSTESLLFKPYIMAGPESTLGLALDGGNAPMKGAELPEVEFGAEASEPLYLVLFMDWHDAECRKALASIQQIYQSSPPDSLPPLVLTLLPHVSSAESRKTHEFMIRVYSMTGDVKTYPTLLRALCQEGLSPTEENITSLIAQIEPDLPARMTGAPHIFDERISNVFSVASAQLARNKQVAGQITVPQLVGMDKMLTDFSSGEKLVEFLRSAAAFQTAFVSSPDRLTTIQPGPCCPGLGPHTHDHDHDHDPQAGSNGESTGAGTPAGSQTPL